MSHFWPGFIIIFSDPVSATRPWRVMMLHGWLGEKFREESGFLLLKSQSAFEPYIKWSCFICVLHIFFLTHMFKGGKKSPSVFGICHEKKISYHTLLAHHRDELARMTYWFAQLRTLMYMIFYFISTGRAGTLWATRTSRSERKESKW